MSTDKKVQEELEDDPAVAKSLSRRSFLSRASVVGAVATLVPGMLAGNEGKAEAAKPQAPPDHSVSAVQRGKINLTITVNGEPRKVTVEPRTTLLSALRDHMDPAVTGPKMVCDRGQCGACTVLMDGKPVYSCMILAADAVGKEIVTVEGLSPDIGKLHPVQAAFVEHDALQCGFCTPGFVMSVSALLERNPNPTEADVRHACAGNVCRCGTYPKVFAAALDAAGKMRSGIKG